MEHYYFRKDGKNWGRNNHPNLQQHPFRSLEQSVSHIAGCIQVLFYHFAPTQSILHPTLMLQGLHVYFSLQAQYLGTH